MRVKNFNEFRDWPCGVADGQQACQAERLEERTKLKGRDIGYALAARSCEGASRVEACTVTAPDVITTFAVPNPNCSSQSQSVFSGLAALQVALPSLSPNLLRIG